LNCWTYTPPVRADCGQFHAVSIGRETANSLVRNNYLAAVSLFHVFLEKASSNSNWQSRPPLQTRAALSKSRETAQQRPVSLEKTNGWVFQPVLKQRETVCDRQQIKPRA
jgi:hypothetical protein